MSEPLKTARAVDVLEDRLEVELECSECGATFVAGVWDHSFRCTYCGSVLACARALGEEVFAVSDGGSTALDGLSLLIRNETESHRNALIGRAKGDDGSGIEFPALIEAQVAEFQARLERELSLVEAGDFLVPYELHERTVFQGVLGRRGGAKESIVQSIRTEDVRRRYDSVRFNLRDRGLKLRGSRVALLQESHLARAGGRALEVVEPTGSDDRPPGDRAHVQLDPQVEVIARLEGICSERRLRVWKQLGFARVRRGAALEDYLIDRQFGTVAGRLEPEETAVYRALAARPLEEVLRKPVLHAIASECPNCGAELALSPRARIAFCATCALGIRVTADGLSALEYELAPTPTSDGADALLGYPYWAFPARVRAGGCEFRRIWDWLERVSPQPVAMRFRENDPADTRLFVPARAVFGSRELDDAFAALVAVATWRQPTARIGRPQPDAGVRLLDVELDPEQAAALARFGLVALHDRQSTRRLSGLSFKQWVADAELSLGAPQLVVLPLPIHGEQWLPGGRGAQLDLRAAPVFPRPVARAVLEDAGQIPRRSLPFSLR